ncbi:hypothetical protein [Bradyrhizobium nanningense]|uniref:hypothetical protein n=1 Tax=Bradyrhizobium nanningense TaxID=1325118 RepID=UPI0013E8AFC8|nr:hypothetical protein [Bradyrhizobium nanningense]
MIIVKVSHPGSIVRRPEVNASYFQYFGMGRFKPASGFWRLVRDASDAYATGIVVLNPEFTDQNTRFWALLKSAKSRFSYSTKAGTIATNALDLSPAIARFQEECFKIFKANAHHRLREPTPWIGCAIDLS